MNQPPLETVLSRLPDVVQRDDQWQACCPAHDDRKASLSITEGRNGRAVLYCHAGCKTPAIVAGLGLEMSDLFLSEENPMSQKKIIATYDYTDAGGNLVCQAVRYDPKGFTQRRPDPDRPGQWIPNMRGVRYGLYRLDEVLRAVDKGRRVILVEGEKDADNLARIGFCATTNIGGGSKWKPEYTESLRGAHVVIIPDDDATGEKHLAKVGAALAGVAASVKALRLPGVPPKGDVSDWLNAGGTAEQLEALADKCMEWTPAAPGLEDSFLPAFDGPPRLIRAELLPVPAFNLNLLPLSFRGWVADISRCVSCPVEYPACAAMVAFSAVVGRRVGIRSLRFSHWIAVPNLWGAIVGSPGTAKSPAISEAAKPLARLEAEAAQEFKDAMELHEADVMAANAQAEAMKKGLSGAAKRGESREALRTIAMGARQEDSQKPTRTRYQTHDTTVEKLGELLAENPNGIFIAQDELTALFRNFERAGHEGDKAFYLKAWNGNDSHTVDRIGRGTIDIAACCVSLFGGIQPGPLAAFLRGAASGEEADGFASRIQLMVYPDPVRFRLPERYPDTTLKATAYAVFERLATLTAEQCRAEIEEGEIPFLRFDDEAQAFYDEWLIAIENRKEREGPLMAMHLSKYRSLLPSLALLLFLADGGAGRIPLSAAQAAASWCEVLESHARRIYHAVTEGDTQGAATLAERIKAGKLPNPFTFRDVHQRQWGGLTAPDQVNAAIARLLECGWLASEEVTHDGAGRPTMRYHIHPDAKGKKDTAHASTDTLKILKIDSIPNFEDFEGVSYGESAKFSRPERAEGDPAEIFPQGLLSDGPVHAWSVPMEAQKVGISDAALRRAALTLGVEKETDVTTGGQSWKLPQGQGGVNHG